MPAHNNYKAKWLAALKDSEDSPTVTASNVEKSASTSRNLSTDAALALDQIKTLSIETVTVAKKVLELLDETKEIAGMSFGQSGVPIDKKITQMPVTVMLRRVRDTLKMVESRYGITAAAADDLFAANAKMSRAVHSLEKDNDPLRRTIVESAWIGSRPTSPEFEDFKDCKPGEYRRFGMQYDDLSDDWLDRQLMKGNQSLTHQSTDNSSDSEDDDDNELVLRPKHTNGVRDIDLS